MRASGRGLAILAASVLVAAEPEPAGDMPGWMAGCWEQQADGRWSEECWMTPRGDIMLGAARSGTDAALASFEHSRIVRQGDGSLAFIAQPQGGAAVAFPLLAAGPTMVEFANPAHDYPQRIRYWRDGLQLKARTSLMDGSKAQDWEYVLTVGGE